MTRAAGAAVISAARRWASLTCMCVACVAEKQNRSVVLAEAVAALERERSKPKAGRKRR